MVAVGEEAAGRPFRGVEGAAEGGQGHAAVPAAQEPLLGGAAGVERLRIGRAHRQRVEDIGIGKRRVDGLPALAAVRAAQESESGEVRMARPKSLLSMVALERELSEAAGRKVDLLTEGALSPYLRDRILGELQVLYAAG